MRSSQVFRPHSDRVLSHVDTALEGGGGHVTDETGGGRFCKSRGYQDKFYMTWEGGLTEGGGSCY